MFKSLGQTKLKKAEAYQIHLYQHLHPIREKPEFHLSCFSPILHLAPYQDHLVGHGTNFLISQSEI